MNAAALIRYFAAKVGLAAAYQRSTSVAALAITDIAVIFADRASLSSQMAAARRAITAVAPIFSFTSVNATTPVGAAQPWGGGTFGPPPPWCPPGP